MEKNVGGLDRVLRLVVGPALLAVGVAGYLQVLSLDILTVGIAVIFGLIFLITGITQQCVVNKFMGVNTRRR
jgi:hypothetical protein